ncbi:hypothetical protein LSH36_447g00005 [Paralvinella palmiformis]|uniref:Zinc finger protein 865 n=1 Tax=Paralvinella palmiformis TaxID=53620 RepID=A0AAD9MXX5_9ANNE|nr:hypothetical protein LSH36_447g00005 [Paralvinella palmiformis]
MCDICGNTYMYKSNLEVHYEVHGEAKKHECKVCGKLFKTYPTLYSHYLVHSDKNPFTCSQCGKAFKTKERLKAHSVRHSGLKPFICDQCGSSFPDKGGLSKHRKTVHAEVARYACPVCGKPCNRADNLRVHMKVHGDPSLLKLSLDELSSARKAGAESSIKSAIQQQQLDSGKSVDTVQAKLCLSPTKLSSGSQQTLHVMEPASSLDIHLPVQHPAAYIHSNSIAVTQQQQQQSSSADQQLPAVNNPQDLTSQVGATPFIGLHHWGTADGAIQYQNLLLSQSYPAASMVQAQVHSLEDANGVVYQATTQQEAGQGTQY